MNKQKPIKPIIMGTLLLFVSVAALRAQEAPPSPPPPPPPPGGAASDVFFFNRMEEVSSARIVKGSPYSAQAVTEINQTLMDGNEIHHKTTATLYRDSEGRTRVERTLGGFGPWSVPENKTHQIIRISDPVAAANYILNPDDHTAEQLPERRGRMMRFQYRNAGPGEPPPPGRSERGGGRFVMRVPPPTEGGEDVRMPGTDGAAEEGTAQVEPLGAKVIEGVQAEGTRKTVTIPAGRIGNVKPIQIVTERWYSNQLQAVVLSKRTDPRVGETVYRLTNISSAEPAASLFQVPAGYTIKDAPSVRRKSADVKPKSDQ